MDRIDAAWLAGLFEGEGCFQFLRGQATTVGIVSTDLDVLEKVQNLAGGKIIVAYEAKDNWKKCWRWYLPAKESTVFVKEIYEFLCTRRRERADEFLNSRAEVEARVKPSKVPLVKELLAQGLTQRQVAKIANCSQPYVNQVSKI